ncbi:MULTISPECIES: CPBP family intramembrane glutamic endopeptidase [Haloferax]|nr:MULTISPECIES: CPBP family intramembrane glutamic endopeptidase [Haloferax]
MATSGTSRSAASMRFEGGLKPLGAFLVVTTVLAAVLVVVTNRFFGSGPMSPLETVLYFALGYGLIGFVAWRALRREGLRPSNVGLSLQNVVPGVVLVAAIWAVATLLGALAVGGDVEGGIPAGLTAAKWLSLVVAQLIFVGPIEEFAFRGYFQNKFVALFDGGTDRTRKVVSILVATVIFALWHIPQRLVVQGLSLPDLVPSLAALVAFGLLFGVIYELTRNVVFTGVLHGTFNFQPILVLGDSGEPVTEVMLFVLPLIVVAVWGYRRWATGARQDDFGVQSGPSMVAADGGP